MIWKNPQVPAATLSRALLTRAITLSCTYRYQPRFDVVVSSEFGSPNAFKQGFDPSLVVCTSLISCPKP